MNTEFFEKFLKTYRPSGFEAEAADVFVEEMQKIPEVKFEFLDKMWNACVSIGSEEENAEKILISGHSDQNCLIVTEITKNGFLKYATQGGISPRTVIDSDLYVIVENPEVLSDEEKYRLVPCFCSYKAIHLEKPDDRKKNPEHKDLVLDLGCTSKEQVEEPVLQEAICFNGGLQENSDITAGTRAEEGTPLSDLANTFQVWAFKNMSYEESTESYAALQEVMHDYTVNWRENSANTTTSNSSGWEYVNQQPSGRTEQSIKYWDLSAKAYKFFGYVLPTTGAVEVEFYKSNGTDGAYEAYEVNGNYSKCRMSFTTDAREEAAAPYFSKLWFSNNSPGSEHIYPSMVKMQFFKPFAKVRFMFKFAAPDEPILIELPHFFPTNQGRQIHLSGTFRLIYPLTGDETKESWETEDITYAMAAFTQDYYEAAANETDETVLANQKHWYTVLPAKNQGAYTLTVRVNGEERACYVPAEYMDWLPGYSYTYIFKVNEDGGVKFDAINIAFTDWQGNTEKEKIVYNW